MVASPLAATVVTAILRFYFCAAKVQREFGTLQQTGVGCSSIPQLAHVRVSSDSPVTKSGFSKHAFREVPFGFRRGTVPGATLVPPRCPKNAPWSLPVAPRMPKNKSKEAYLVPAPKARLYPKVLIAKCLAGGAEGPYQGQPLCLRIETLTYRFFIFSN